MIPKGTIVTAKNSLKITKTCLRVLVLLWENFGNFLVILKGADFLSPGPGIFLAQICDFITAPIFPNLEGEKSQNVQNIPNFSFACIMVKFSSLLFVFY